MRRRSCPTRIPEGFHDSVAAHLGDFTQSADEAVVHVDVEVKVGYRLSYPARAGRGPCSATIGDAAKTSSATRLHAAPLLSHPPQRCHPSVFFSIRSLPRRKTVQKGERLWFERRQTSFFTVRRGSTGSVCFLFLQVFHRGFCRSSRRTFQHKRFAASVSIIYPHREDGTIIPIRFPDAPNAQPRVPSRTRLTHLGLIPEIEGLPSRSHVRRCDTLQRYLTRAAKPTELRTAAKVETE